MSKIICDVCGTRYPDSSNQCPICGCIHNAEQKEAAAIVPEEELMVESHPSVRGGRFSKSNVRKRNKNQPIYEEAEVAAPTPVPNAEEEAYDSEEEFDEGKGRKSNVILNVLLVIVIAALLAVSAYIGLEYFMPNLLDDILPVAATEAPATEAPTEAPVTEASATEASTEAPETEPPQISCEMMEMEELEVTLTEAGQMYLLNVLVTPADTTDTLMYISSNEDVATVSEEGRVTAVGEGSVMISIFCGEHQLEFHVECDFSAEEETEAPAETEGSAEAETEAPAEGETEAPAQEETTVELKDVVLSVKTTDMTFRTKGQQATIKLTCKLSNQEVTWTSENEAIATVDKDGVITRIGTGTTTIIGQYGDQKIEIIVRCPKG